METKEDDIYISHSGRQTKRKTYSEDALMAVAPKKAKSPQVQNKYKAKKKLTNEEIMKRSLLFKVWWFYILWIYIIYRVYFQDSPHTNKIFGKLVEENKKRQLEEEEMERFQQTLVQLDDEEVECQKHLFC